MNMHFVFRSIVLSCALSFVAACSPPQAASVPVPQSCTSCGIVQSITPLAAQGSSTGTGAVIGAVVGGVAGNQVGGGSGKDVATAAGVIGGALLGNTIEKNRNGTTGYSIVVDMQDGSERSITVVDASNINVGSAVNVYGKDISLR